MAGKMNDGEKSVPSQKKAQIAPPAELADEMAVDAKQPMFSRDEQAINHFKRISDDIMVILFILSLIFIEKIGYFAVYASKGSL